MKRFLFFITNLLCLTVACYANDPLSQAKDYYDAGDYSQAILIYDSLLQVSPSAELQYNIGNAYYKNGDLGQSILHYERAVRLRPGYADAKYNLKIAESRIVDNLKNDNTTLLSLWLHTLVRSLSEQTWIILSLTMFLLFLAGIIVFSFVRSLGLRKTGFYVACCAIVCSIVFFAFAGLEHKQDTEQRDAIVMQSIVSVKSSPDNSGTDIFVLHEGAKVYIRSTLSEWAEIQVSDNVGWVKLSAIERI